MYELFNYDKILDSSVRLEKTIMFSKIAGITFDNRQALASHCYKGMKLTLRREYDNEFDANAVSVRDISGIFQYGYIPRETAVTIASLIDNGKKLGCYIEQVNIGPTGIIGINIRIVDKM